MDRKCWLDDEWPNTPGAGPVPWADNEGAELWLGAETHSDFSSDDQYYRSFHISFHRWNWASDRWLSLVGSRKLFSPDPDQLVGVRLVEIDFRWLARSSLNSGRFELSRDKSGGN